MGSSSSEEKKDSSSSSSSSSSSDSSSSGGGKGSESPAPVATPAPAPVVTPAATYTPPTETNGTGARSGIGDRPTQAVYVEPPAQSGDATVTLPSFNQTTLPTVDNRIPSQPIVTAPGDSPRPADIAPIGTNPPPAYNPIVNRPGDVEVKIPDFNQAILPTVDNRDPANPTVTSASGNTSPADIKPIDVIYDAPAADALPPLAEVEPTITEPEPEPTPGVGEDQNEVTADDAFHSAQGAMGVDATKRRRRRAGYGGTILTGPLGIPSESTGKTILG